MTSLDLSGNVVQGERPLAAIGQLLLSGSSLTKLNISGIFRTPPSKSALADVLVVTLSTNSVSSDSQAISRQNTLCHLDLRANKLGNGIGETVFLALKVRSANGGFSFLPTGKQVADEFKHGEEQT